LARTLLLLLLLLLLTLVLSLLLLLLLQLLQWIRQREINSEWRTVVAVIIVVLLVVISTPAAIVAVVEGRGRQTIRSAAIRRRLRRTAWEGMLLWLLRR
jgi:O-antigen/teichoic acid export membrane protein